MLGEGAAVALDRPIEVVLGERVGSVLHRVGGDDVRIVAVRVDSGEVAFEGDRDGQVVEPVTARISMDADDSDGGLAVAVRAELDHRPVISSSVGASCCVFAKRSIAMSMTASSARWISASRFASRDAAISGSNSARARPATKMQYR